MRCADLTSENLQHLLQGFLPAMPAGAGPGFLPVVQAALVLYVIRQRGGVFAFASILARA